MVRAEKHQGLRITGLSKRFGSVVAVDALDLGVDRGSVVGFLGPNGAGKTTAMRAILGLVSTDTGEVTWNGAPIDDDVRGRIGYMPQERGLYARMRVAEQIVYFGRIAGLSKPEAVARADYWMTELGLSDRADSLVQELSGGNQQRVQLAVSLVHQPDLLVLDEPFAGLDPVAAETMRDIVRRRADEGVAVLFSSHQLDLVEELCDEVVIIAEGRRRAAGTITELRTAAPSRHLRVRWVDPLDRWVPAEGTLTWFDGSSATVELPSGADEAAALAAALAPGPVVEVAIEPATLEEVFAAAVASMDDEVTG